MQERVASYVINEIIATGKGISPHEILWLCMATKKPYKSNFIPATFKNIMDYILVKSS